MGILFAVMDATWLSDITDMIGYGKKRYSYVINGQGAVIAHPNRDYVLQQRNFIEEAKTHKDFTRLAAMLTRMTKGETGYDEYPFGGGGSYLWLRAYPGNLLVPGRRRVHGGCV
jgi:methyl-accepting chemotaxis protein